MRTITAHDGRRVAEPQSRVPRPIGRPVWQRAYARILVGTDLAMLATAAAVTTLVGIVADRRLALDRRRGDRRRCRAPRPRRDLDPVNGGLGGLRGQGRGHRLGGVQASLPRCAERARDDRLPRVHVPDRPQPGIPLRRAGPGDGARRCAATDRAQAAPPAQRERALHASGARRRYAGHRRRSSSATSVAHRSPGSAWSPRAWPERSPSSSTARRSRSPGRPTTSSPHSTGRVPTRSRWPTPGRSPVLRCAASPGRSKARGST